MPISDDTILRRLKKGARPAITGVQVVGIDEWAKRKGRRAPREQLRREQAKEIEELARE